MKQYMSIALSRADSDDLDNQSQNVSRMENNSQVISTMTPQQVMRNLTKQHQSILNKISKLDQLNTNFQQKQQKQFLKAFLNIMDRMSNQLIDYQQKIRDIDQQIARDEKCVALAKQMNFFRNQCLQLRKVYQGIEGEISQQKIKNEILQQHRNQLDLGLFQKSKKLHKYRTRANSLQICYQQNSAIEEKLREIKTRTIYGGKLYSQTPGKQLSGSFTRQLDIRFKTATVNGKASKSVRHSVDQPKSFFLNRNYHESYKIKPKTSNKSLDKPVDRKLNF